MPDWLTHTLVGWITGKSIKIEVGLVVIGSLIPDIAKIGTIFQCWLGINLSHLLEPIHTPVGAFLVAGIAALFFDDIKKAFMALSIGVITHFILDYLLIHSSGGTMKLLFPFSWSEWQYGLVRSENYWVTIITVFVAVFIYIIYNYKKIEESKNILK